MATRSLICKKINEKQAKVIYCHWDGYLSNNGFLLKNFYDNSEKVDHLLELGSLSSLGRDIVPNPNKTHTFKNPQPNVCVFYMRDRGDENEEAKIYNIDFLIELAMEMFVEYVYLYEEKMGWQYAKVPESTIDNFDNKTRLELKFRPLKVKTFASPGLIK